VDRHGINSLHGRGGEVSEHGTGSSKFAANGGSAERASRDERVAVSAISGGDELLRV
jgi:hypothetical protein